MSKSGLCPQGMCNGGFGCQHTEPFKGQTKRIWYSKGWRDGLSAAIKIFELHKSEPMTGNVVLLELKGLRGDYKTKPE